MGARTDPEQPLHRRAAQAVVEVAVVEVQPFRGQPRVLEDVPAVGAALVTEPARLGLGRVEADEVVERHVVGARAGQEVAEGVEFPKAVIRVLRRGV